jgi:hypothetical protein
LYHNSDVKTFNHLAESLIQHIHVAVPIASKSETWGHFVAGQLQTMFINDSTSKGTTPFSASYDGFEEIEGETEVRLFKFSLENVTNKSIIHHAKLISFKEEEL